MSVQAHSACVLARPHIVYNINYCKHADAAGGARNLNLPIIKDLSSRSTGRNHADAAVTSARHELCACVPQGHENGLHNP